MTTLEHIDLQLLFCYLSHAELLSWLIRRWGHRLFVLRHCVVKFYPMDLEFWIFILNGLQSALSLHDKGREILLLHQKPFSNNRPTKELVANREYVAP